MENVSEIWGSYDIDCKYYLFTLPYLTVQPGERNTDVSQKFLLPYSG